LVGVPGLTFGNDPIVVLVLPPRTYADPSRGMHCEPVLGPPEGLLKV
jgi:hypothetical protein